MLSIGVGFETDTHQLFGADRLLTAPLSPLLLIATEPLWRQTPVGSGFMVFYWRLLQVVLVSLPPVKRRLDERFSPVGHFGLS